ncbi:hypothetical protein QFC19_001562 [Naganishia cerealis]|uniref:Uncharacterized protein n=1 Tax=Naganishia cerealis TaxID=610337 RepID=A0ACC2WG86_9TREE|nr:hypothetical protein QFC19_001562 [Naganishia cerealis]
MDLVEQLAKQASQITMYDIKSYYNHAKNAVLNVSEMEAKVREATNDDSWGASSTLMQEIAQGPGLATDIQGELTDSARVSRLQELTAVGGIVQALTLLEYLVKNGSERVVDDARSHVSTIKMLRSFHYIDEKGKDQGINVRNRAKELADLLGDIERIRQERRKAKQNRNKYSGVAGGSGNMGDYGSSLRSGGGGGGSQSRYGGFGSDSYNYNGGSSGSRGGYSGRDDYDSGDLYRGSGTAGGRAGGSSSAADFDQYDAGDDEEVSASHSSTPSSRPTTRRPAAASTLSATTSRSKAPSAAAKAPAAPAAPKPVVDLFDFDDEVPSPGVPAAAPTSAVAQGANNLVDDDEFADFQAAPTSGFTSSSIAPAQALKPAAGNVFDFLDAVPASNPATSPAPPAYAPAASSGSSASFGAFGGASSSPSSHAAPAKSTPLAQPARPTGTMQNQGQAKPASSGLGGFDDLWNTSLSSAGGSKASGNGSGNKTIAEMEREKTMASLWGSSTTTGGGGSAQQKSGSSGFEDLLG